MAAPPIYNDVIPTDVIDIFRSLELGLVVTVYFYKKRPERRTLRVKLETKQLLWIKAQGGRPEGTVNLREVKEIRPGKNSRDFDKWPDDARRVDKSLCFVVFYGNDFKLKTLSVVASTPEEYTRWQKGLEFLVKEARVAGYQLQAERWLRREFYKMAVDVVTLKQLKAWMHHINYKISNNKLREKFQDVDTSGKGELVFEQFAGLFHNLIQVPQIINENFDGFFERQKNTQRILTVEKFQQFLKLEQQESPDLAATKKIMSTFLDDPTRAACLYFTEQEFEDYLFSKNNTIWDSKYDTISQPMNHPLSHYWIASSHNTYLTGDQYSSESSTEAYARALRMGCRCIELDCWDGPDGYPHIFHGHTLTSKIKFMDLLKTIRDHAWEASHFPLILSIENHCSLGQQRNMAMAFKNMFGEMLLTEPASRDTMSLPSPEKLKYRIILKHKKLPEGSESNELRYIEENPLDGDVSNSVKNGILYLDDPIDRVWHPHFFVLTNHRLYYTDETGLPEPEDDNDEEETSAIEGRPQDELHFSEKWFHGKLVGGRHGAEHLLTEYGSLGDGTFLVRESETFVGDFSLSFLHNGKVNHCRIKSRQERGQVKYHLIDTLLFDSLYNLIVFYRQNPLRAQEFQMVLREPFPQPQSHAGKEWYHEPMDREAAEDMLKQIPYDGAFLLRRSGTDQYLYAISFRADGKIKHCRIKQEGRLFLIGMAQFESLVELVQYYEKYPLYKKMKLKYPVNQEMINKHGQDPEPGDPIYEEGIYHTPNAFISKVRVKALHDYTANRDDELSFCRGAIIVNVNKHDNGWWRGDYGERRQNWFPANFVEEIEPQDDPSDSEPLGALQKGSVDVLGCIVAQVQGHGSKQHALKIYSRTQSSALEVACDSEAEMKDWMDKIKLCADNLCDQKSKDRMLERSKNWPESYLTLLCIVSLCLSILRKALVTQVKCHQSQKPKWTATLTTITYHKTQLSRVYPKGQRLDSSNYDPTLLWNCGTQMCALNYQTPDRSMQLNEGRFKRNASCGYVLQPEFMRHPDYNPLDKHSLRNIDPLTLTISIIAGRHFVKTGRGIASPFVEIETNGLDCDISKYKTLTVSDNGLNPLWKNETAVFDIICPDLALIRFVVQDEDVFGDPNFLGQATFPVTCLRKGFRSVPLKNGYSEDLELAALLIHIDITNPKEDENSDIYASIQELRDKTEELVNEIESIHDNDLADTKRAELRATEERLIAKNEERKQRKHTVRQKVYRKSSNS
ncbi:hypothetical protein ScPMuIL_000113 [Solemya velum]